MQQGMQRPIVEVKDKMLYVHGIEARVTITEQIVSIGCTDITHEAMDKIVMMWAVYKPQPKAELVIQEGSTHKVLQQLRR